MSDMKDVSDVYYEVISERLGYSFGWDDKETKEVPAGMTQEQALSILDQIDAEVKALPGYDGKVDFGDMDFPTEPLGHLLLKAFHPTRYRKWAESFSGYNNWEQEEMWEEWHESVTIPFYSRYGYVSSIGPVSEKGGSHE